MDRYTVFGNPISQSKSPQIHQQFAEQTQQSIHYDRTLAEPDNFAEAVTQFRLAGGCGANVTAPFKQQAFALCQQLTERARRAEAVNTLYWQADGSLLGDNTDGIGLVTDLIRLGVALADQRILILGAGGAVRGILAPLLAQQPQRIVIANRTESTAQQLANDFADLGSVQGVGLQQIVGEFDLVLNGTAASLTGELPSLPKIALSPQAVSYDLSYGTGLTPFQQWGQAQGLNANYNGIGMLVEQAAASFQLWRQIQPDTATVLSRLIAE
ncbi:shikimate dehydrogenase [Ferrimonas senticii]|uniref:shikimate dehydrogenase n=1 Tax=Ferrimonas senticii TaxID=394566 RepID=UPI00040D6B9D|nr:shikimate dehydrogenase [Ferrimonas senticii]